MILNSRYPTQCTVSLQNHVFNANPDVVPENQDSLGGGVRSLYSNSFRSSLIKALSFVGNPAVPLFCRKFCLSNYLRQFALNEIIFARNIETTE